MSDVKHTPDWYARRDELLPGMVFRCRDGSLVQLDQRTEGDGTQWDVLDWNSYGNYWAAEGGTIEPGDLDGEPIEDPRAAIARVTAPAVGGVE